MEKRLLTVKEACEYLNISKATLYKLIKKGDLKPIKLSNATRFDVNDIEEFIKRKKQNG